MEIVLSKRLELIASLVTCNGVVADIGCDHGYLSISLINSKKVNRVYAVDIGDGPLEKLAKNMERYGIGSDKIIPIKADGAVYLAEPDYLLTDIVIAGMGGELIWKMIQNIRSYYKNINFVFAPNTRVELLREKLYLSGFEIKEEFICPDGKYVYNILNAVYKNNPPVKLSPLEMYIGKYLLENKTSGIDLYIEKQKRRLVAIIKDLKNNCDVKTIITDFGTLDKVEQLYNDLCCWWDNYIECQ